MGNKQTIEKKQRARQAPAPEDTENAFTVHQLAFTAAGAAGAALLGAVLARQGWAPKTVSAALAALGAGLAWVGDSDALFAIGAGAMSGSGAQLVLILFSEYEGKNRSAVPAGDAANTNVVPLVAQAGAS